MKGDDAFSRKAERFTVAYQWARRTRTCTATAISSRPYLFPSTPSAARAGRWPRDTDVWGRVAPRAAADGPRSRCGATCQSDEPAIKIPAPTCLLPPLLACSTTTPLSRSPPISVHAGERGPLARHPVSHQAAAAASVPSLHAPPSLSPQSFHRRWLRLPICYLPNLLRVGPVRPQPNPAPPPTPQGTRASSSRRRSSSGELPALPPRRRCAQLPSNLRKLPYPRVKQR